MTIPEIMAAVDRLTAQQNALCDQSGVWDGHEVTRLTAVWALRLMATEIIGMRTEEEVRATTTEALDLADTLAEGLGEAGRLI